MPPVLSRVFQHSLFRGMAMYSIVWPASNIVQQNFAGRKFPDYDYKQALRFSIFGSLYVAPCLHFWMKFVFKIWPKMSFTNSIKKVILEQCSYSLFAISSVFFGLSLLEGKNIEGAIEDVKLKFFPTYKTSLCYWPFVQLINFTYIPEKNRVVFISFCSFIWVCYLSYMQSLKVKQESDSLLQPSSKKW